MTSRPTSFRAFSVMLFHAVALLLATSPLHAGITEPCMSVQISLAERMSASRSVVYGRVISQRAMWDDAHRSIYTVNRMVVNDVWKDTRSVGDTINVLTEGGDMGTMGRIVIGTLRLDVGDQGYLLLEHPRSVDVTFSMAGVADFFRPYAEVQALFVESSSGQIIDCWGSTKMTTPEFEQKALGSMPHQIRSPRTPTATKQQLQAKSSDAVQADISFTPKRAIGGMGEAITITGTGFGDTRGTNYVTFTADGKAYFAADYANSFVYRKWSDTEIIVEVPPCFTNKVHVVIGSTTHVSPDSLHVTANLAARTLDPLTFTNLINMNGAGGYTWSIHKDLFDVPEARNCVESVMRQFRCKTGMSFTVSQTASTVGYALNDGINSILFDAPGYELGAGAVAYCDWVWYSCSGNGQTFYYVRDSDCRLSRKFNWYYGNGKTPEFGMAKLRYILYHEIGHAHQFGHVNEPGETMHPVVQALPAENWLQRDSITESEQRAGNYMTQLGRTFTFRGCGVQPLLAPENTDCASDSTVDVHEEAVVNDLRVWPNPASTVLNVQLESTTDSDATVMITDMLGEQQELGTIPRGAASMQLSLSGLSSGQYVVSLRTARGAVAIMPLTISR